MNPKLRKRFVDSIEYLRKMDFFRDYSNLTSEEVLERIFRNEIKYSSSWWFEEPRSSPLFEIPEPIPHGLHLLDSIERYWEYWMKKSDFEVDRSLIPFDVKRVMCEAVETWMDDNMGPAIIKRLARISRGVFQPTNVTSEWMTPPGDYKWSIQRVDFDFKGKRHKIQIVLQHDFLVDIGLEELNELIKDIGYQYYQIVDDYISVVVLTKEEAEKLKKERGWKFKYIC